MSETKEVIRIVGKTYLLAALMMLPTANGIHQATQGHIALSTIMLASGLVGAIMTNLNVKKELDL
ncbi:hypothetical protein HMPREF2822_12310 [Corynebacterium sp. HMSC062E11]|uniref:hypothetical protein n=1 Tax=Corynebacterium sp. HMSC062E11 TaxID=1739326 RepID=UPI0008A2C1C9|nr:hypothetical protein [Corynebacterium sp. HMSC062E11]OFK27219.1 hypothetical protein HMPREF2822_12310 [Corynebacterium sp. HMSC062E11]